MIDIDAIKLYWHPIASSSDLPDRHVFHAQLFGRELAVWRADDGTVNAWENRCLHRGVRLSIGVNNGAELVCQYHGWRYTNRTAECTYIPAHPADAPARTICNTVFPVQERFGLIWCAENTPDSIPRFAFVPETPSVTALRPLYVKASLENTAAGIIEFFSRHGLPATPGITTPLFKQIDPCTLIVTDSQSAEAGIVFYLQAMDAGMTAVRGLLVNISDSLHGELAVTALLKNYSNTLNQCRAAIEHDSRHEQPTQHWDATPPLVSEAIASMPPATSGVHKITVQITAIELISQSTKLFRLEASGQQLPATHPGAHIDVHLPNGMIRQYSLINGPGQTDHYAIAVKHLDNSSGGSKLLHTSLKVGDLLATSVPRTNFSLRRDAEKTLLIAGGIGITPLISMARTLEHSKLPFTVHYFASGGDEILFAEELQSMSGSTAFHTALSVDQTNDQLRAIFDSPQEHQHAYLCGPPAMISSARDIARQAGWPDNTIHFEYFKNTSQRDVSRSFKVDLARSGLTLDVPGGLTLLQVLRNNNVAVPSSCEQGACGTCKVTVMEGEPDHQDVYLNDTEKARGDCLMSCVSRARSDKLVLDL